MGKTEGPQSWPGPGCQEGQWATSEETVQLQLSFWMTVVLAKILTAMQEGLWAQTIQSAAPEFLARAELGVSAQQVYICLISLHLDVNSTHLGMIDQI